MRIGDFNIMRLSNGEWPKLDTDFIIRFLDYIESHGLDKADEKIAELSQLCDEKDASIASYQNICKIKDYAIREANKVNDILEVKLATAQSNDVSYKQRFLDEAAMHLWTNDSCRKSEDAWTAAKNLWNARPKYE